MNGTSHNKEDIPQIESVLGAALRPVEPRSAFISGLRTRLVNEAHTSKPGLNTFHYLLLMMVGVITSILLILTGARAIIGVIGAMSILRLLGDQAKQKNEFSVSRAPGR